MIARPAPSGPRGNGGPPAEPAPARSAPDAVGIAQGLFYAATGAWSIVGDRSFQAVTGPKTDVWLVKTVGALVAAVGGALAYAGARGRTTPELALVGAGCAAALAAVDATYVARGRISRVYLLDAAAELALVAAWGAALRGRRGERHDNGGRSASGRLRGIETPLAGAAR
ncbi:MAG TPA: hypothetical protein VHG51_04340 [Longimicrobiaceae bacterium]|nr:hypothetical protein [Longimicrobiaceae bacterium]